MTKRLAITKQFRLIDFHTYDESPLTDVSSDDNSEDSSRRGRKSSYSMKDDRQFVIQMFGINEQGDTCSLFVRDFQPFFYVKVTDQWTQRDANRLLTHIQSKVDFRYRESVLKAEVVHYQKLYGFTGGKQDTFVKLTFRNTTTMNKVKNLWYIFHENPAEHNGEYRTRNPFVFCDLQLELYESNIPPLLRYFHIQNISPTGWVSFRLDRVSSPSVLTTTCKYEYVCSLAELKPMPNKETPVPYKICSFDIEASSSHGDFPVPVKTYKRLVTNLVDAYRQQNSATHLDAATCRSLCEKVVLTAFGYGHFEDVDLVYPKTRSQCTKERIRQLLTIFLDEPVEKAKLANDQEDNSYLLTIDSIFERIKETVTAGEDGSDDAIEESGQEPEVTTFTNRKPTTKRADKKSTILDILMSDKYERDDKIQMINDVMTMLFPRLKGDEVTFIGSTFMRYGDAEPYLNHCLVVGSCDPVAGATIESVDEETDLLVKWTELIQDENPDIIIGYNIFGFDYEFMFRRAQENGCDTEFLKLSRRIDEVCGKPKSRDDDELVIETAKLAVASGEYELRYPKMVGRLQIDMLFTFRRDFTLSSFKLDDVACQFICDDIKRVDCVTDSRFGEVTELYSKNMTGLHIGDFIHIEITGFSSDYYRDGEKFRVLDIVAREVTETVKGKEQTTRFNVILIQGHHTLDTKQSLKWGTAKDDVTPQDIFRLSAGSASDRAIVAKYCIQDCNLVQHLMNKVDVITGHVEMGKICSVPISFLVFRGQGIKLTSFVAKKCRDMKTLMPDIEKPTEADGYEGAIVLPPKCSIYMDNPVACVDYSSLYPSSMISQNLSHDSKVWTKEYDLAGNIISITGERDEQGGFLYEALPGYEYIDLEFDTYKYIRKTKTSKAEKTKSGRMICRWAQFPNAKKGIMPTILEELLKARKDTRALIKTEKDPFMQNILDKRQLGYKVTANSLYGQCGSRTSTFYEKDIAASTTATGRMMITYARRMIEEVYGDTVYNTAIHGDVKCKAEYIYGDSVANYTPVYVQYQGAMTICAIDELAERFGNNQWRRCQEPGKEEKEVCELVGVDTWSERGWTPIHRVIRHVLAPHKKMIRVVTDTSIVDVTDDHSLLLANEQELSPKDLKIGQVLLHHSLPLEEFTHKQYPTDINTLFNITADHVTMAKQIAHQLANKEEIAISTYDFYNDVFGINGTIGGGVIDPPRVRRFYPIPYEGYVYDLTTKNHHFAAGIGNMIVHNTDSVFFTFNLENPITGEKIRGKPALEMTIEIAQDAAHLCTQYLKSPMELSYEKTLMPFILVRKKKYVGMLYETDPNKGKMKIMGLSVKRRDTCDYFKDVYGGVLTILMSGRENTIQEAITFVNRSLTELVEGHVPMDKLSITKALRSYYKNPQSIAHKVLADRIGKRDPGNKPKAGDRIRYVCIDVPNSKKALMGERIETPEFIIEKKLKIDYNYYITNQLMRPLQQLFGLCLEQIWGLDANKNKGRIKSYHAEMEKLRKETPDLEVFIEKREKVTSAKVKLLLFDAVLKKIDNEKQGIRCITDCYGKN